MNLGDLTVEQISRSKQPRRQRNELRSQRKIDVLETINNARIITSETLKAVYADIPEKTLWYYVSDLLKAGYIDKIPPPLLFDKKSGRPPIAYASRKHTNAKLTEFGKIHPYMISQLYGVLHAASRQFEIPLSDWEFEPAGENIEGVKTVNPDASFDFGDELFFIEIDRGTEPLRRSKGLKKGTDIWTKLDYYTALHRTGLKFRVLFLTVSVSRLKALHRIAFEHDQYGKGLNIFWFGLYSLVDVTDPTIFFHQEHWFIPSDDIGRALFKR